MTINNKYYKIKIDKDKKGDETMKKFLSVKWENVFIILTIPLQVIQVLNAHQDFKLIAILTCLTLYEGLALAIHTGRKETLQEIKEGTFEPLIDFEEMFEELQGFINSISQMKKKLFSKTKSINHNRQMNVFSNNF